MKQSISRKFNEALANGSLIFTPTTIHTIQDSIPFQVRFAPSLNRKPKPSVKDKVSINPFLPPDPNLLVGSTQNHNLVLNKYCISRDHLLITTKEFVPQMTQLDICDFEVIFKIMKDIDELVLFFYNCGSKSGASVNHKHIQMLCCKDDGIPINDYILNSIRDGVFQLEIYKFVHACCKIDFEKSTPESLDQDLTKLLEHVHARLGRPYTRTQLAEEPEDFICYNLLFTHKWMMVVPRSAEAFGNCNLNSVGYSGMILAKSQDELQFIQNIGPMQILNKMVFFYHHETIRFSCSTLEHWIVD